MPIPDDALIDEAVERYFRERDRYVKLADVVEELLRGIVRHGNILASVISRANTLWCVHKTRKRRLLGESIYRNKAADSGIL